MNLQAQALEHEGFIHIDQAREAALEAATVHVDADRAREIVAMPANKFVENKHTFTVDELNARKAANEAVGLAAGYVLGR